MVNPEGPNFNTSDEGREISQREKDLKEVLSHALPGIEAPKYPEIWEKMYVGFHSMMNHIVGSDSPQKRKAALRDTVTLVNEYISERPGMYEDLGIVDEKAVKEILERDYGVKI